MNFSHRTLFPLTILFLFSTIQHSNAFSDQEILDFRLKTIQQMKVGFSQLEKSNGILVPPLRLDGKRVNLEFDFDNNLAHAYARNGFLVSEEYKRGSYQWTTFYGYSMKKSLIGMLIIINYCENKIEDNELMGMRSKRLRQTAWSDVKASNTANMASGVVNDFVENYQISYFRENLRRKITPLEKLKKISSRYGSPGVFHYSGFDTNALGIWLEDIYGEKISDIFRKKIWTKISSQKESYWQRTKNLENISAYGFMATARDWIQIGRYFIHLYNSDNCFKDKFNKVHSSKLESKENTFYGNQFWLTKDLNRLRFRGYGGQRTLIDLKEKKVLFIYSVKNQYGNFEEPADFGWRIMKNN